MSEHYCPTCGACQWRAVANGLPEQSGVYWLYSEALDCFGSDYFRAEEQRFDRQITTDGDARWSHWARPVRPDW